MEKIEIAGLNINPIPKPKLLTLIRDRIRVGERTWITTLYSEFLFAALKNRGIKEMLNQADISLPDGIGILWSHKFLSLPLTAKTYFGKILQSFYQAKITLLKLLFTKKDFQTIPGSELIWDIAKMANENNRSIYLLGGFSDTSKRVSNILISKYPNIKIAGHSNKNPDDTSTIEDIKTSHADILLVAYGPIRQEEWIYKYKNQLPDVKLFIGLGGTFDYIAGKRIQPPSIIRKIGLEWLFRLITQPHRIKRIYNATFGLIMALVRYKIFQSYPFRPNVVSVVLNKKNEVLVCKRNEIDTDNRRLGIKSIEMINIWQFPQGGRDEGEKPEQTALRECKEEVNISDLKVLSVSKNQHSYLYKNAFRPFFGQTYIYKGQKQDIVYLKFFGSNDAVKVDMIEFVDFKWIPINNLITSMPEHKKPLIEIVLTDLKEMSEKAII